MNDPKDKILESCLEEVLGRQTPPELSSQILQSINNQAAASADKIAASTIDTAIAAAAVAPSPVITVAKRRPAKRYTKITWLNVALTASVLIAVVSVAALAFQLVDRARDDQRTTVASPKDDGLVVTREGNNDDIKSRPRSAPPITDRRLVRRQETNQPDAAGDHPDVHLNNAETATQLATGAMPEDAEVVALINSELQESWRSHAATPAGRVNDETWCFRVYASVLGREPTGPELAAFLADITSQKRETMVERLLTDPAYSDQFSARCASLWIDLLIGPGGSRRTGDVASREGLREYLEQAFSENKPLDQMARELIAAKGSGEPGAPDFNGAANFLLAHVDNRGTAATARTARVFLGSQLKCAQCHDYEADGEQLAQRDYWQLNAFFRQVGFERRANAGGMAVVDRDFDGEGGNPRDAELYFETPKGLLQVAFPVLDNQSIPTSGYVDEVNRREELAKLITNSERFGPTVVNHFWKAFFAYELPSHPKDNAELVDGLAEELRASGYDAKRLVRWIALSDAFSLSDRVSGSGGLNATKGNAIDAPEFGGKALFSRFYPRKRVTDSVYSGLAAAVKAHADGSLNARMVWYGRFVPQDPSLVPGIGSDLVVPMSGPPSIRSDDQEMIQKIAKTELAFTAKVRHLFWATVTRDPSQRELKLADELVNANSEDTLSALEAVWLVLINSDELVVE